MSTTTGCCKSCPHPRLAYATTAMPMLSHTSLSCVFGYCGWTSTAGQQVRRIMAFGKCGNEQDPTFAASLPRFCAVFTIHIHIHIHTVETCNHSAPLKKNLTCLHQSAPFSIYVSVLAAPICRGKMPSELHQETRKAPRDSEALSITHQHCFCPRALRNQYESGSALLRSNMCQLATGFAF